MKLKVFALAVAVLCGSLSLLAKAVPMAGTLVSEQSVDCGTQNHGKKSSTAILCQQYVLRTATTEYQIRQPKPSNQDIIPANTPIEFTIDKSKLKFKYNGKSYEFLIVGTSAVNAPPQ
jgi:hypothetical protein